NGSVYVASFDTVKVFKIIGGAGLVAGANVRPSAAVNPPTVSEYATGLSQPEALVFNAVGELFVANRGNNQIRKVPPDGGPASTFAQLGQPAEAMTVGQGGELIVGTSSGSLLTIEADGTVTSLSSGFGSATALAVDSFGHLYIGDAAKNLVFQVTLVPVFAPPRLEAGQIVLEWQGAGKLQSASEVTGPWAEVIRAAS